MTLADARARVATVPHPWGCRYEVHDDDSAFGVTIWSSVSRDGKAWSNDEIERLAVALGISPDLFEAYSDGCECCGYGSQVLVNIELELTV